jgi:uncharacterized membrane protein
MLEALREFLAPYYLHLKWLHLLAVMVWMWSTAVAYAFYLVPVFKAWRRNPGDRELLAMRDWVMERFDHGVIYEHIAFPVILITGPLLYLLGGWTTGVGWLALKLLIVVGLFVPIEILDYHLSHFGGNKERVRSSSGSQAYELAVHRHWLFLLVSSPVVMIFGVIVVYLAVTKSI